MRFFRLLAITGLLLACVVLGSACAGAKGVEGPQGEVGATGATGPAGPAGADGAQGPQGLQGIQGEQGEKGDPGLPGVGVEWKGEWSSLTTYKQNDAVGYEGSSYVSVQDANTNHVPTDAAWWDLWLAKGETGAIGPQGETGHQGPQGEQGPVGPTGADGAQGPQGVPGPNMIVAMGNIAADGTIIQGYRIHSVYMPEEEGSNPYYEITLIDIYYEQSGYVTVVTPADTGYLGLTASYMESGSGKLIVNIFLGEASVATSDFSFMVLQCP